jgi:hypothetical protein
MNDISAIQEQNEGSIIEKEDKSFTNCIINNDHDNEYIKEYNIKDNSKKQSNSRIIKIIKGKKLNN